MIYRRRYNVEAIQYDGTIESYEKIKTFIFFDGRCSIHLCDDNIFMYTRAGGGQLFQFDWIVKDSAGRVSVVKPDIFEKLYEPVKD